MTLSPHEPLISVALRTDIDQTEPPLHPGEILREDFLPHFGVSATALATRLGVANRLVEDLISERRGITPDLAVRLGRAFGQSSRYWHALQRQYDVWHAHQRALDARA